MNVVLADSSELIQEGLKRILNESSGIDNLTIVNNNEEMTDTKALKQADVLVIDFVSDGFTVDAVSAAQKSMTTPNILAITHDQSPLTIINALRSGVKSYVKKTCSVSEIKEAIESTSKGEAFFCGQILEAIRAESIDVDKLIEQDFTCEPVKLSQRELEIIELIAEGHTNSQIAVKLFLSAHTINTHRKNLMAKLGVNNTAAIVMYAVKTKLISPNKFLFNA